MNGARIEILGAAEHNLKNIDVAIPLHRLVCVTGVSGSGKSTLVQDVLYAALLQRQGQADRNAGRASRARAAPSTIDDVVLVDQSPIGRTTRSNPASYVGAFDAIRKRFAATPLAQERGYTPGTFSFNSGNGAARPAAATASSTSRCSSSPTSTCAAPTATASAIAPRCSRSRSKAGRSPTCSR